MASIEDAPDVHYTASYGERLHRVWELHQQHWSNRKIAQDVGVHPMTVSRWLDRIRTEGIEAVRGVETHHGPRPRLSVEQLHALHHLLQQGAAAWGFPDDHWTHKRIASAIHQHFGVSYYHGYIGKVLQRLQAALATPADLSPYFATTNIMLYRGDAGAILALLPSSSVDCIVTSPPYYGQRDYGVPEQLGLEAHPQAFIDRLVAVFAEARRVLKPTGSLWVNLGDTYWSGKGQPGGPDLKQRNRRFLRPQDRAGQRPWCAPKQLLLIPHRFAIAMQDAGWIVRNDNVWHKANPTPDPVDDRSAAAHEYMFHFVQQRHYYYDHQAVAVPSQGERATKAPSSVWTIQLPPNFKKHIAVFPEILVRIPILATLPPAGVLLDPFCGSGTALNYAVAQGGGRRAIGIDISEGSLAEARDLLMSKQDKGSS